MARSQSSRPCGSAGCSELPGCTLRSCAASRRSRLLEQFLQRVGTTTGAGAADPARLWEWLENHPRLPRAQVQQLREWYAAAGANRNVPLIRLHNLILSTERQLAQ